MIPAKLSKGELKEDIQNKIRSNFKERLEKQRDKVENENWGQLNYSKALLQMHLRRERKNKYNMQISRTHMTKEELKEERGTCGDIFQTITINHSVTVCNNVELVEHPTEKHVPVIKKLEDKIKSSAKKAASKIK